MSAVNSDASELSEHEKPFESSSSDDGKVCLSKPSCADGSVEVTKCVPEKSLLCRVINRMFSLPSTLNGSVCALYLRRFLFAFQD
jgi:hypothetical protein